MADILGPIWPDAAVDRLGCGMTLQSHGQVASQASLPHALRSPPSVIRRRVSLLRAGRPFLSIRNKGSEDPDAPGPFREV